MIYEYIYRCSRMQVGSWSLESKDSIMICGLDVEIPAAACSFPSSPFLSLDHHFIFIAPQLHVFEHNHCSAEVNGLLHS
jgi:hypothetical protein